MTTIADIFGAYADGAITQGEFFASLLQVLSPTNEIEIRRRLSANADAHVSFDCFLDAVANGADVMLGKQLVQIPLAARAVLYKRIIRRWIDSDRSGEPDYDPDLIASSQVQTQAA